MTKAFLKTVRLLPCAVTGALAAVFGILYLDGSKTRFIVENVVAIKVALVVAICALFLFASVFVLNGKDGCYRIPFVLSIVAAAAFVGLYFFRASGLEDKVDDIDDLREYVSGYGALAIPVFILIQFLQVVALPVPGVVTIGAGAALFGPFLGAVYSLIGILSASLFAFFIGKRFGIGAVGWMIGKDDAEKWLTFIAGKDKAVLTFMFLFPFFPDDILCFVAGLSSMKFGFYAAMMTFTRTVTVFFVSYSVTGALLPYDTPGGIAAWIAIFALSVAGSVAVYKNGEKIEAFFKRLTARKGGK